MTGTEIRIRSRRTDRVIEGAAFLILISLWAIVLVYYRSLPHMIPVHFNFDGVPDRFGSRSSAFIPPAIVTAIVIGLQITSRYPRLLIDTHRSKEQNEEFRYDIIRFIKWMQLSLAATFLFLKIMVLLFILRQQPLSTPLILCAIALNFVPTIGIRMRKRFRGRA